MQRTTGRMVTVAVVVCGFAVGMAGLLNYFKYRSTANRIVTERLVVTGKAVENVVQVALDLGLQFDEITTLPATLDRERRTDNLIQGIDIFDAEGKMLYSTDPKRASSTVPAAWLAAAAKAHGEDWMVDDSTEPAAGMMMKTSFGVAVGQLALRYSNVGVESANGDVAKAVALDAALVFVIASALAALSMTWVMRHLARDVAEAEAALLSGEAARAGSGAARGPFGAALRRFIQTTRNVEAEIADLASRAQRGHQP